MTKNTPYDYTDLESLIEHNTAFALYRLPQERHPYMIRAVQEEVRCIDDLEALNGQSGFVIAPFDISPRHPVVCIETTDTPRQIELPSVAPSTPKTDGGPSRCTEEYRKGFGLFAEALHDRRFSKLVLSRCIDMEKGEGFSLFDTYANACATYPDAYVFVCYTPQTGVWLGSTPEIILSGEGNTWNVVALAGTQPLRNGCLPQEWSDKNREEQEFVAAYIRDILNRSGHSVSSRGPYTVQAGALAHLKTEFHFRTDDNRHIGTLLKELHPTPAVCGLPKTEARDFILRNEGYDRGYYSGFVGMLSPATRTDLYVNLRCMNITHTSLRLYAGGGLVPSSELDDEWTETENKLATMRNII